MDLLTPTNMWGLSGWRTPTFPCQPPCYQENNTQTLWKQAYVKVKQKSDSHVTPVFGMLVCAH